ncbi:MAG: tyrosine--tRNA ligase [Candidatus Magasanikbacteria bacterium RIFCSPLOWO2_02_FULL_44_11]|uniref:Tyrosine--tRNA ligase n=2 Tax=Candidatus Magasanikiibacteriota TaxID=1752731 RepID=A0A1F6NAV3_9BACT|nr:MAG: tyrosine--tRNA ligase [Candidatus Magasanikbacteria bacterium RIFCSPHIGHO2_02_FULL_45_10]OGH80890.1 MAG: tyrosine--tRNA ligase [Candidatus Magasanikbacteria bacterium RIFCSPLOWO2_02_FULL_44_11]
MKPSTDAEKIKEVLERGVEEVIERESLQKKLFAGKPLRIKFGIDPTGADLHLGHAVPLRKLRAFQDLGHQVILLIGDYTALIGDPTGRSQTRPILTPAEVKKNMKTYTDQAALVLDMSKVEIRYNSEWYGATEFTQLLMELTSKITVARILERDDFQKRLKEGSDIQMQELLYPLLQGYDSVALKADVELGGTDQKFNLLMGRKLQKRYEQPEQDIMTVPLLEGTDGEKKMSKSYDNYIALLDAPEEMFGKVMSIPDKCIIKYFELATDVPSTKIEAYKRALIDGANPRDNKMMLGSALVKMYHSEAAAKKATEHFVNTFKNKERPADIPSVKPSTYDIITVLIEGKLVETKSDARRAIEQGGVKIDDVKVESIEAKVNQGSVVQKGKRFFVKVV